MVSCANSSSIWVKPWGEQQELRTSYLVSLAFVALTSFLAYLGNRSAGRFLSGFHAEPRLVDGAVSPPEGCPRTGWQDSLRVFLQPREGTSGGSKPHEGHNMKRPL